MVVLVPQKVRKKVLQAVKKAKVACDWSGDCSEVSEALEEELTKMGIQSELHYGWFHTKKGDAGISHTWVMLPEFGNVILDPTSNQFGSQFPEVWFPANPRHYETEGTYRLVLEPLKVADGERRLEVRVRGHRRRV